jgi:hypothetical protein
MFVVAVTALAKQSRETQTVISGRENQAMARFSELVNDYAKLRADLEGKLPKVSRESSPEKIEAHRTALAEAVRAARTGARRGDIFDPEVANHIQTIIRREFKGKQRNELRETILEADTKGAPLRVNYNYPETKELTQIPPTLLQALPKLPDQLRYRFTGRHLLLVDRETRIIIDYMLNALP